jgi:hypothetical protein
VVGLCSYFDIDRVICELVVFVGDNIHSFIACTMANCSRVQVEIVTNNICNSHNS